MGPLHILKDHNKASLELSLQAKQPQTLSGKPHKDVFHLSDHYCGSSLGFFLQVHVLSVLRTPEMTRVLQQGLTRVKGKTLSPALLATLPFIHPWTHCLPGLQVHIVGFHAASHLLIFSVASPQSCSLFLNPLACIVTGG